MKKEVIILLTIILSNSIVAGIAQNKISPNIYNSAEKNEKVRVVVELENKTDTLKKTITNFGNFVTAEISEEDLPVLEKNSNIKKIEIDIPIKLFLQESTKIINASVIQGRQTSWTNLTGNEETVCIIDSGIDTSHPDFTGKILNQYCYCSVAEGGNSNCCLNGKSTDTSALDNAGHGTHVAGIVTGIGIKTSLVIIKVTNSSGDGIGSDLQQAIQRCVDNSEEYNISVITISLGGSVRYTGYCDIVSSGITNAINNAAAKNISVTIATGNHFWANGISWPSCVENATPIGWSNKDDTINNQGDRNWMLQLLAPGTNINSTCISNQYCTKSGSSMSTPHVAGAIAIIKQFLKLTGQSRTPQQIESILNSTGKSIDDSAGSGLKYSRINIYNAILSLDNIKPNVNLISPSNNYADINKNHTFRCNATDFALKNISFYLWNSTDLINITSQNISQGFNLFEINISNLETDDYKWNCLYSDENNNKNLASANFTLTIKEITSYLLSPSGYTNANQQNFTCESKSNKELTNITFYLWNSSELIYTQTKNLSGSDNLTIFNFTLKNEDTYKWNCLSADNNSEFSLANENLSLTYDTSPPIIRLIAPAEDYTATGASEIEFNFTADDNLNISICELFLNGVIVNNSMQQTISYFVSPGNYLWSINCTDLAGNSGNSSGRNLIVNSPPQTSSSSGGSSSGSSSKKEAVKINESTNKGKVGDIYNVGTHKLLIKKITNNSVTLFIENTEVNLKQRENIKLNLTSENYYDLFIELKAITDGKADLDIKLIYEPIEKEIPVSLFTGKAVEEISLEQWEKRKILAYFIPVLAGICVFLLGQKIIRKKKTKTFKTKNK